MGRLSKAWGLGKAWRWKKAVACLLVLTLVMTSGMAAFAQPSSSKSGVESSAVHDELLRDLEDEYGAEQAASLLQTVRDLGLIDGKGNVLSHLIYLNGKGRTLDEMKQMLVDESTDLTQTAEVDGAPVRLDVLKKIIAIEDRLELARKTLGTDEAKITSAHLDSLNSLIKQADEEGLVFANEVGHSVTDEAYGSAKINDGFPLLSASASSAYDDETYIMVKNYSWDYVSEKVELWFELNKAHSESVSFSYELMDGALGASLGGTFEPSGSLVIPAGQTKASLTIKAGPASTYFDLSTRESYKKTIWSDFSRADYIHFHTFRNFDYMEFDGNMKISTDRFGKMDYSGEFPVFYRNKITATSIKPFMHAYEGGAYLAYAPSMGSYMRDSGVFNPFSNQVDNDSKQMFYHARWYGIDTTIPPQVLEVHARGGTYTTGQILPIQVLYSNFITHRTQVSNVLNDPFLELANGSVARPEILDYWAPSNPSLSFVYGYQTIIAKGTKPGDLRVIKSAGEASTDSINFNFADTDESGYYVPRPGDEDKVLPDMEWNRDFTNHPDIKIVHAKSDAFKSIVLDKSSYTVGDTATVTVQLENADDEANWVINGGTTPEKIAEKFIVSIGDKSNGHIELDWKEGADGNPDPTLLEGRFEITEELLGLMSDSNRAAGKLRAKIYYNRDKNNEAGMDKYGLLSHTFANFTVEPVKYIHQEDLSITYPVTWPSGEPYQVYLTNPVTTQLGSAFPLDATYRTSDQFAWRSSDEAIAAINSDGTIIPKKAGTVTFTLTAKNNGKLNAEVMTEPITIKSGGLPVVVVPDFTNKVVVQKNKDATISWLTNVMDKYKELAGTSSLPADANFTLDLYQGNWADSELATKTPIKTWSAPSTRGLINAYSFTIPGANMTDISNQYIPSYTVRISTDHPTIPTERLSALSYIVVKSPAAIITLDKSMGQFITDDLSKVELKWNLENFDSTNLGEFEFKVTKNGALIPGSLIIFDKVNQQFSDPKASKTGGTYSLAINPVSMTSNQIKDVYAITLSAKNGLDSTWSYDSLYLQVYKHDALKIQIDGASKSALTMSNMDAIKNMTNDERVALKRNINLKNEMTINNKDYKDMGEIADQLRWSSSNNDIGAIYMNNSGEMTDITRLNYFSYQPKQRFLLSGLENGKTTISATHARTGMETTLDVAVNTLRDKLYLFQFYPKTLTTIAYTDRKGVEKTFSSNASGEMALYDEDGIGSDVYVTSDFNHTTFTGVISQETLLSKEQDAATMGLYPINILQLRQLSKVEVFFKTPDGNPYTGKVTYRGGVYKNGNYCEPTEISGTGVTELLGADGRLEVTLDTTDFYSKAAGEKNAASLSAKDKLDLVFEFAFEGDQYYPQLITFDGNSNAVDLIAFAEKISDLIANPSGNKAAFMVNQFVMDSSNKNSILTYKGKFGPNNHFPNLILSTEFLWWDEQVDEAAYAELYNEVGYKPQGQSYQTFQYPFSDFKVTRHTQVLNKDTIWLDKAQSGPIHFKLYDDQKEFRKSFISSAALINMIGVEEVDSKELGNVLDELKKDMDQTKANTANPNNADSMMQKAMGLFGQLNFGSDALTMKVIPTNDPLIYKTIISTSFGNLPTTGAGNSAGGSSSVEFLKDPKTQLVPGLKDLYRMKNGTYLSEMDKEMTKVDNGQMNSRALYSFGGYYVGEVKYNTQTEKWENIVLGGGFHAGGGFERTRNVNTTVGPFPVTFSLSVGGGLEVDFKSSVLYKQIPGYEWSNQTSSSVNDYLTSLRINAYVEAFGGIGFDYSVIAAKIGVFGRITLENTTSWLNRDYLADSGKRVIDGDKLTLEGIVGIKAVLKFLFFSKSWTFASLRYSNSWVFKHWNEIQEYWKSNAASPLTAADMDRAITAYMNHMGIKDDYVFETSTLEDRSYLSYGERSWNAADSARMGLMSLDPVNAAPAALQTNAYPYADPQLANDGSLFVYMSDGNSTAIEDTAASWAKKVGDQYVDQGPIATDPALKGYGDSNLQVAGEGDHIAAVWVRQKEKIEKESGEELVNEDIMMMNNSTEVMASIYDGTSWSTHRLTHNSNPDLAPVVSINNGKVFVAYRSVYAANRDNPLDFSDSDSIVYTVYDEAAKQWSDVETLYNGTNGTVMGLSADTLSDGTAAVVYSVNKGNVNQTPLEDYVAGSDNEIIYAVMDTDKDSSAIATTWRTKGVVKNLQVTNDLNANENPQITSAFFTDDKGDPVERFIIAWHSTGDEIGFVEQDIKLLAVNKDGGIYTGLVDSLNALQSSNEIKIHPNFTFAKLPEANKKIENLSILWKETEVESQPEGAVTRDVIKAVKFGVDAREVYLSGAIDVAAMPDFTQVDKVDAYISNAAGTQIKALILGTTYTTDADVAGSIKNGGEGEDIPVHVSKSISAMYTATETYANKFHAAEILFSPAEIVVGYDLPVQFNIVNQGISKVKSANIRIDGQETVFNHLSLDPNNSKELIVSYAVPALIKDVPYEVEVSFADGEVLSTNGTLNLDIPDLGISSVQIVEEASGKRTLSVPIYNKSDAAIAGKGKVVKLGLYKNTIYTDDQLIGDAVEIKDQDDLSLIDQGGFAKNIEVDLKEYLKILHLTEIPEDGIPIYLHAWVEAADGGAVVEFDESNNDAKVDFENLSIKYSKNDVLLLLEQTNTPAHTTVNLSLQNMRMAPVASGNVLLNLLDRSGKIIESKYVAADASSLLSFAAEEKKARQVQFEQKGESVQAMFFVESSDALDSSLSAVALSGVKVNFDPSKTAYPLQAEDLKKTQLYAAASNPRSTITLLDKDGKAIASNEGFLSLDQPLKASPDGAVNEFTLSVRPESASGKATHYKFAIANTSSSKPSLELVVKGTRNQEGKYVKEAEISLSPYDVNGFDIAKARYAINNGPWTEAAYNGKTEQSLASISKEGIYTIAAKIQLTSGLEYDLDPVTFEVMAGGGQNPNIPTPTPPDPEPGVPTPTPPDPEPGVPGVPGVPTRTPEPPDTKPGVPTPIPAPPDTKPGVPTPIPAPPDTKPGAPTPTPAPPDDTKPGAPTPTPEPPGAASTIFKKEIFDFDKLFLLIKGKLQATSELEGYPDIQKHWALAAIQTLSKLGVIQGYPDHRFKPDRAITRAEFASMLVKLLAIEDPGADEAAFTDVREHWAKPAILALARHGIVKGYGDASFKPDTTITREEIVVMVMRLLNAGALQQKGDSNFTDRTGAAAYAREAIDAAAKAGIVTGDENHAFKPKGQATRAETAAILIRMMELDPGLKGLLNSH